MTLTCRHVFKKPLLLLVVCTSLGLFACRSAPDENTLRVVLPQTALRAAPGERAAELCTLQATDQLEDLGAVSNFESPLRWEGQSLTAPWLQVKTTSGQTGWIFAGAVQPVLPHPDWLLGKRLRCYFGTKLPARRNRWLATQASVSNARQFADFFHEALALRDTFTYQLVHRAEPNPAAVQPELLWLEEALPGFVFQRIAQGTQPYLFTDYRYFQQLAARTADLADDQLLAIYLATYPTDSIESIAPVWTMQTGPDAVVSQLGLGHHWRMLQLLDSHAAAASFFQTDLLHLKAAVLSDILDQAVVYWQPVEKILTELNKIRTSDLAILTAADRSALQARSEMFKDPAANGLRVNLRAGE